jgi:hypothetical protein
MTIRVVDTQNNAVPQAKTLLFFKGGPLVELPDSNGAASFEVASDIAEAKLVVQKDGYAAYDAQV